MPESAHVTCSSASTPKATTSGTPRRARNQTFENIYALPRLHELFARHGVRPTYVDHAIRSRAIRGRRRCCARCRRAATARSARTITRGRRRPVQPRTSRRHPYASNLPLAQFERSSRPDRGDRGGRRRRPVSYRSGRFGFSAAHVVALERQGYLVESSVAPLFYEAHKGGPDFVEAPLHAVLPRLRQRDAAGHERRARGAGLGGAEPRGCRAAPVPVRARAAAVHDQAGPAQARASRACDGCGRRTRRSTT